jgi:hypothetical protein
MNVKEIIRRAVFKARGFANKKTCIKSMLIIIHGFNWIQVYLLGCVLKGLK